MRGDVEGQIRKCAETLDHRLAARIVDHLRFIRRLTYDECERMFFVVGNVSGEDFEQMMQDADGESKR